MLWTIDILYDTNSKYIYRITSFQNRQMIGTIIFIDIYELLIFKILVDLLTLHSQLKQSIALKKTI